MSDASLNIGVIGTGAAGMTAAWLLHRRHRVTLFEKADYVGGHTNTIAIPDGPDAGTPVDTGFIVLNDRNYPTLHKILERLGVAWRWSDMSFGFSSEVTGLEYAGTGINGLLAQRVNLLKPSYWRMWSEVARFCKLARAGIDDGSLEGITFGEFLAANKISDVAIRNYIVPMGAAIWSAPQNGMLEFPAESLMRFWNNHGLLSLEDRPRWQTVVGGSQSYVRAMLKELGPRVTTNAQIEHVRRDESGAVVRMKSGEEHGFDRVVLATHADQALGLLADPSGDEKRLLGSWTYSKNFTVLHSDESFMPANRRAWASWNYVEVKGAMADRAVPVTYWMNLLQGLKTRRQYFVTLNPTREFREGSVVREINYEHPQFTSAAVASQADLPKLNGVRNTFFCGSYFGYGFHEDAVRSGAAVAKSLGVEL